MTLNDTLGLGSCDHGKGSLCYKCATIVPTIESTNCKHQYFKLPKPVLESCNDADCRCKDLVDPTKILKE